ncbi:hypothetical protein GCM10007415_19030 [Parapedobacter pyrenivorans]|uniref:DUF4998 domain-containing protein n=1 Tax=Parapedobacter pyrenivorans TaxID=1305674 RepID=A0A917HPT1_9SPHI|nr:DUF4998 domain-containing protein [Parapedobacter pyrenivorans]GGG85819.1 hypothetical protein GCM10007415_19030 [Parapedobacter pyrenivorans]
MKKTYRLFPVALSLLVSAIVVFSSCDKMNDIQQEWAEQDEQVYLGKVDSIEYFPGFGRAKIIWYIGSDPKIDQTIIYWNMRQDSIVKDFNRTGSSLQKDSIILEDLPEGSTLFEFRNVNNEGETSLYSNATVNVWGPEYADGLRARTVTAFDFDYSQSLFELEVSPVSVGDSVVYSQIVYTNTLGQERTLRIERDANTAELTNFPDGGEFRFQTVFFPPQGIDTVFNNFSTFKAPVAITERGIKISFAGEMESKYFHRNGEQLYEWNTAGDLIVYAMNADGSLTQTETYPSIVPRDTYRDFFFYDDDKFIGISTGNAVTMHQIEGGVLTAVGAGAFGSGFAFPKFIPARGYFFSVAAETGEMKTWLAQNNATWGTPNGATVGTGFDGYEPLMLFNNHTLLGVDADGYLRAIPVTVSGTLGSQSRIGSGWDRFAKIVSMGTKLLCMEENGDFYIFDDFNTAEKFWIVDE